MGSVHSDFIWNIFPQNMLAPALLLILLVGKSWSNSAALVCTCSAQSDVTRDTVHLDTKGILRFP